MSKSPLEKALETIRNPAPGVQLVSHGFTKRQPETCVWTEDADGVHATSCGRSFAFDTAGAIENGFKYCPYCGKPLKEGRAA